MSISEEIVVVSGLPRSGTSLMMQMLEQGGIEIVTDNIRAADTDNPRGYREFERVKKVKQDASWLPATRGKAVKMISQLLYDLPPTESYRVIFMERDFDEMLSSQEKMLARLNQPIAPRDRMKQAYAIHLERLFAWLPGQANFALLKISYNELMTAPMAQAARVHEFLGSQCDLARMTSAIDPDLYRNRTRACGERVEDRE
jgi:RNase adaptor protein for sRNA GlmZ degradation